MFDLVMKVEVLPRQLSGTPWQTVTSAVLLTAKAFTVAIDNQRHNR